mgnify:CR=1 FL=1
MKARLLVPLFLALLFACTGDKPLSPIEATDEEAIYNLLFNDYWRLTTLDIIDQTVPDTAAFIADPDSGLGLYWHKIDSTREYLTIDISPQPVPSPVGDVYQGNVLYENTFYGSFFGMRYNASADTIERMSKAFAVNGRRSVICQQWGFPSQVRRGWLITSIGDVRFLSPGQSYHFLDSLAYRTPSQAETTFVFGNYSLDKLRRFSPGEQVTVNMVLVDSTDLLMFMIPYADFGYRQAELTADTNLVLTTTFIMPSRSLYGQLRFLLINAGDWPAPYKAVGYSFIYRIG